MDVFRQLKSGASQFLDTLEEGWNKLVSRSGQALTRFTRRGASGDDSGELPDVTESWGVLAGEVAETDSHLIVRLEAPGMEKDDFEIAIERGVLTVRGEKRFEQEQRHADYHVFEAAYGSFERSIALPREVDSDRAEATYHRGVLTVRLPKVEARNVRKIKVG